jgi:hypothetical protein
MAKIRNTSGEDLEVPSLGRMVLAGQVIEVPDDAVEGFTHPGAPSQLWAPSDQAAKDIHQKLVDAAGPPPEAEPAPPLDDLTKTELEVLAEARGLSKSGTKAELVARLTTEES